MWAAPDVFFGSGGTGRIARMIERWRHDQQEGADSLVVRSEP
jgi:hypothetical protein